MARQTEYEDAIETSNASGGIKFLPKDYVDEFNSHFEKSDEQEQFEKFFDEMNESNDYAKITVYRVPVNDRMKPISRKLAFLFEVEVTELTFSQICSKIRDEYGSGLFRIAMRDEKGSFLKQRTIAIEAPEREKDAPESSNTVIAAVTRAMRDQSDQMQAIYERMNHRQPSFDFEKIINLMVPLATVLSTLGVTFKREPQKSTTEMLQEFAQIKELFDGGNDSGESNIFSLLEKSVTSFGPALAQAVALGQERGQVNADGKVQRQLSSNPEQSKVDNNEAAAMKPQLEFVLSQAQMNNEPVTVADFLIDNIAESEQITDEGIEQIITFLKLPDCFKRCVAVTPGFEKFPDWFASWQGAMVDGLEALFTDDENSPLTDDKKPGQNGDNVTRHDSLAEKVPDAASNVNANPERASGHKGNAEPDAENSPPVEKVPDAPATDA